MNILITGATGLLGGRIASYLNKSGLHTIYYASRKKQKLPNWINNGVACTINWDSKESIEKSCKNIDLIIHLASMNAKECNDDPIKAVKVNITNTAMLLDAAQKNGVNKIIYFSTTQVYGAINGEQLNEESLAKSLHPYSTSHRAAEDLILYSHQNGKIQGIVLRLSNSFGYPMDKKANCWMLLVNDLCRQISLTNEIKLSSSGVEIRDFISISDVCEAVEHVMSLNFLKNEIPLFNLASGKSISVLEMANKVRETYMNVYNTPIKLLLNQNDFESKKNDFSININKIARIGFNPKNNIENELKDLFIFCKKNFNENINCNTNI